VLSPHFSGRVAPVAPALRGGVIGLSPIHRRSHLARATLESIAFEYRRYADVAQVLVPGSSIDEVIGTGGGSRSQVWNQIKADVLESPYRPVAGIESGTRAPPWSPWRRSATTFRRSTPPPPDQQRFPKRRTVPPTGRLRPLPPMVGPAGRRSTDRKPSSQSRPGRGLMARKRLCMVGAGRVGRLHTRNLSDHVGHRAEVAAIVDPRTANRRGTGGGVRRSRRVFVAGRGPRAR
jgi:hypothetical protein